MSKTKRPQTEQVDADLPITPMLDMSFQLLAFFIMTFHPAPSEAQIAMSLPPADPGGGATAPDPTAEKPAKYIVHVASTDQGTIKKITIREDGAATDSKDLGADVKTGYFKELKALKEQYKGKLTPKITLEIEEKLLEAYVVQLIDSAIQAEFTDIAPVPADPKKR